MATYLQVTPAECGLACLGFVAAHHGNAFSMSELRERFALSLRGATLADITRMATSIGLSSRPLRLELDELSKLAVPCILHWDMNHFVVLTSVTRGRITVHDPGFGKRTLSVAEASRHFTGVALELAPAPEFERVRPKPPIGWRQLIGKVRGLKRNLGNLFLMAMALQIVALIAPLFSQWVVDGAIVSGDVDFLIVLTIGSVLVAVTRVAMEAARGWMAIAFSTEFGLQWAARVKNHLMRLELKWFETRHVGDVVSRFQSMQSIQHAITGRLLEVLLDGLFAIVTFAVMLLYSWKLALIAVAAVACYGAVRIVPHRAFHEANDEVLTHDAKAQSVFLENVRAIQAIKLANLEEQRCAKWHNIVVLSTNRKLRTQAMTLAFNSGYNIIFALEGIAVLALGASMAIGGTMTVGMLMAFMSYRGDFSSRMQRFIDNLMAMRMMDLHVERLSDIALAAREKSVGLHPELIDAEKPVDASISLQNVSFRYAENGRLVLRNVSLEIRPGEHVAIVGPTGCGKTTLAKIILGLLEPTEGMVCVGGVPLAEFGLKNWRRQIGAVMQDDQLLSASLLENISNFESEQSSDRARVAATNAAIHDEVRLMPMGYNTLIGDMGSSLSGGQKQRLLLARALYRQPRVLVLDEATSHLDVDKERQVNELIRSLSMTRVTIAHRPETIAMADRKIHLLPTGLVGIPT